MDINETIADLIAEQQEGSVKARIYIHRSMSHDRFITNFPIKIHASRMYACKLRGKVRDVARNICITNIYEFTVCY